MDIDKTVMPDESNIFNIQSLIDKIVNDVEVEFKFKIDQKIVEHMKEEWRSSRFNMSMYALQKQMEKIQNELDLINIRITSVERDLIKDDESDD